MAEVYQEQSFRIPLLTPVEMEVSKLGGKKKKKKSLEQLNIWLLTQIILKYFQRFSNWFGWHVSVDSEANSSALE